MNRWFHTNLNSEQAEILLLKRGIDGSFLVRPSKSCKGQFSLSVRRKNKVTHIKIRYTGEFYDLHGGDQFKTLAELIQYYRKNQLKEKNGEVFELKTPLNISNTITERWFHGSISGPEAEQLIKEKGSNGSFIIRESQSKLGDFVLTVKTRDDLTNLDKVTHVMIRHHNNKYDVGGGERFDSLNDLVNYYTNISMVDTTGTVVNLENPLNSTSITAADIDDRVYELSKGVETFDGFWEEFEHLQHQECKVLFERKIGRDEKNRAKNRHKNIIPFDYTRVILKRPSSYENNDANHDHLTDYINASLVKLVDDDKTISRATKPLPNSKIYIATQGPLPNTIDDFWWMVWQEKSDCIVMVTKEVEKEKVKCHCYWPTIGQQPIINCGLLEVKIISDSSLSNQSPDSDYIKREFEIRFIGSIYENNENCLTRRVTQYQYIAWPDQLVPLDPSGILNFLHDINSRPINGPMIVHCSAGIGRSGTLIVIDMLIDQIVKHGLGYVIDVQRLVKVARAQRPGAVQTIHQYEFIYHSIQKYIANVRQWQSKQQHHNQKSDNSLLFL